jgi:hypothetical protein
MLVAHIRGHLLKRVTVVMPPDIHRQLKLLGFKNDTTMNDLILTAVHKYLSDVTVQIEQQFAD